ncbi:hypothetical protein J437_LFUL004875 [Ladona fulva]|uniref:RCR-type E3 ubiquitin transferase n=1 Tax=Ladona fulva TaxID=123851 RepID=A0A8K0JU15_LADFU|nr:hypothetical protein J437_LFUL004875 [Ladona fulva]
MLEQLHHRREQAFDDGWVSGSGEANAKTRDMIRGNRAFRCHSNERLFLSDFVHCTSGTSGGRLSWWLQPESYVDPRRCEALFTSSEGNTTLRCGWPTSVTLLTRDQYGDVVHAPNLLVEVKAVPIEKKDAVEGTSTREGTSTGEKQPNVPGVCLGGENRDADSGGSRPRKLRRLGKHRHHHHHHHHHKHQQRHKGHAHHQQQKSAAGSDLPDASAFGGHPRPHLSVPYEVTVKDKMCYHAVTIMKEYEQYSFEELRFASPSAKRCAECLLVRSNGDGTYSASWTPSCAGWYSLHMTVDGYPVEQTYKVEVREPPQGLVPPTCSGISKRMQMQQQAHHSHHGHHHHHHHGHHSSVICPTSAADPTTSTAGGGNGIPAVSSASSTSPSSRLRRFVAKNSAGLRIRAHPSLQSEQIGVVHVNGTVAFVEEIHNDDGVWLRLSPDTVRQYCGGDEVNYLTSRSTPGASSGGGGGVGVAPGAVIGNSGGGGAVVSEAWCLQYNQHLGRTLLVPTEEPKSLLDEVLRTTILRNIPQRKEGSREHRRMRGQGTALPSASGPGTYQVVKCGASGHNVRSRPSLKAPPVGMLELGNQLSVAQDGTWVRLDGESMQKFCFNTGGEAWSLARSRSDVQYLQGEDEEDDEEVAVEILPRGASPMVQPHSVDREFIHDARPQLSSGDLASSSPYPSPKRAFDFSSGISSSSSPRHRARQRHVSSGASSSSSIATAAPPPFNFGGTAGQTASSAINGVTSTVNPFVFGSNPPEPKNGPVEVPPAVEKVEGVQKMPPSQPKEGIGTPGTPGLTAAGGASKVAPEKERESSKFAALQKWLKGEESRTSSERRGSPGRDLPPELVGVSVKELVKAIGESRANGNGVTPPGTPPRRTSRSSSPKGLGHSPSPHLNSRSSSPGVCSVAGTGGVGSGIGAGTTGIGGGSQRRGSAHSDTTSALVSSLTRDLSQSPSGSSSVLTRSADSPNGILPPPPPSITSQPIGINASSSMHRDILGEDKDPAVESSKTTTQTGTQTSPESSRAHFSIGSGGIIGPSADQSLPLRLSPKLSRSSKQLRSKRAMSPASAGCSSRYTNGAGGKEKLNPVKDTFKEVPPMPSPVKEAMSPSVAECLRAAFAALLWHEGVVHDAMACASFLKFHPGLPKNGAVVVARDGTGTIDLSGMPGASMEAFVSGMGQGEALTKEQKARQRHSVEVSMGTYLHIQPSSPWMPELIGQGQGAAEVIGSTAPTGDTQQQQFKTVTVLPPALKALVTLWEEVSIGCLAALSRQGPMAQIGSKAASVGAPFAANQAVRRRTGIVQGGTLPSSPHHHHHHHHHREKKGQRKKKEWKTLGRSSGNQGEEGESVLPYWDHGIMRRMRSSHQMGSAWCELCGGLFPHPVTHHMRAAHPGCGAHSGKGYNSIGQLVSEYVGSCGDGGVGDHLWYLMCEACWEKYIGMRRKSSGTMHSVRTTPGRKSPSMVKVARKKASNASTATPRENLFATTKASLPSPIRGNSTFQQGNVHHFMRANAAFLLDLASAAGTGLPPAREMSNITPRISVVPSMGSHHKRRRRHGESMPLSGPIPPPPSSSSSSSATSMPVVSEHGPPPSNRVPTAPSTSQFAFFELPPASSSSSNSSTPSSSVSSAAEPPFHCLKALGVNPSQLRAICEERLLEETLRRNGERGLKRLLEGNMLPSEGGVVGVAASGKPLSKGVACDGPLSDNESEGSKGRTFHRSISMGTTARESWNRRDPISTNLSEGGPSAAQGGKGGTMGGSAIETNIPGSRVVMRRRNNSSSGDAHDTGSSLLCYASPALQKLVMPLDRSSKSANEDTAAGTAAGSSDLLSHPVLMFLLQQHDLHGLQIAMRQALRRATCRVYAMQALNWLLRNVTQPVCLHDLLWWFVVALSPSGSTVSSTMVDHNLQDGVVGAHRDDNRPERKDDFLEQSRGVCDHPLSDVSVGGEAVDPLQESFHSLLQTVADLMLLLPMGSPLQTMAIRCWGIRFRTTDHAFLHRSHVFSNISKILSRSEEDQEEGITSSMHESHTSTHSFSQPVSSCIVEALKDLTSSVEMKASSRQAMVGSLCDNSTETFWESGDEDRNKTKTITIVCQPHIFPRTVYVHIDNCRDLANKVSSVTFQSGINLDELYRLRQVEVESRSTGWVSCPIIDPSHRVIRLEVKGPDNSLRLRQVRVLGELEGESLRVGGHTGGARQRTSMTIQQRCCETETLRVFRLITSQVFGKLILGDAGEHSGGKSGKNEFEDISAEDRGREGDAVMRKSKVASSGAVEDDSKDLKEHMVGILFSRSKLTHLQRQVCAHIVQAIRKETLRVREEWEALLCSGPQTPSGAGPQGQWMFLNSTAQQSSDANKGGSSVPPTDTYCFEMLSMVLALSGSSVGRAYLSHQYGLLSDLLSLLHTGSARVQRQVTSLLRRMLPEVSPAALASILSIDRLPPADFGIVPHHPSLAMTKRNNASFHASSESAEPAFDINRVGILDVFLSCIAKALTVQVKVKGKDASIAAGLGSSGAAAGIGPPGGKGVTTVTLATCIHPRGERASGGRWWLRGCMNRKLAEVIIQLLKDMAQGKLSDAWAQVTKSAVAEGILNLTRLGESVRTSPNDCLRTPTLWLALASLCVLDQDHAQRLSSGRWGGTANQDISAIGPHGGPALPPRPTCTNHDDGETTAIIQCNSCGNLCADCDRFLHLHRKTRMHQRQVCKEEEEAIKVDLHEGCGRTKLFWILALADSRTLKAMVEFRRDGAGSSGLGGSNGNGSGSSSSGFGSLAGGNSRGIAMGLLGAGITGPARIGTAVASGVCRFCGTTGNSGLLAIGNVCADHECQEHARNACSKLHPCGHLCGGIAGESPCLPCLHGCVPTQTSARSPTSPSSLYAPSKPQTNSTPLPPLKQDADDMCMICFTEALSCAPAIQLKCGHVFHMHCCRNVLMKKWAGPRITFSFAQCPICKADIHHTVLEDLLTPVRALMEDVRRKALMRLEYEGLHGVDAISAPHGRFHGDPAAFAMDRYAYYVCYKCKKAYYGGEARCDLEAGGGDGGEDYDPAELVCGGCSDVSRAQMCPKHGTDFLEYKCRYCCSVAVFFCFGTTHFCNACHDDFQRVTNIPRHELPHCPAGPKAKQLDGEECPLHVAHPPTGEEFALGCGVCRNAHTF